MSKILTIADIPVSTSSVRVAGRVRNALFSAVMRHRKIHVRQFCGWENSDVTARNLIGVSVADIASQKEIGSRMYQLILDAIGRAGFRIINGVICKGEAATNPTASPPANYEAVSEWC